MCRHHNLLFNHVDSAMKVKTCKCVIKSGRILNSLQFDICFKWSLFFTLCAHWPFLCVVAYSFRVSSLISLLSVAKVINFPSDNI